MATPPLRSQTSQVGSVPGGSFLKGNWNKLQDVLCFLYAEVQNPKDPSMSWDPKKWIYPINPILGMGLGTLGGVWIHRENTVHVKGGSKRYIRKSFHQKPSTNSDFLPARFPRSLTTKSQGRQVPCKTQRMLLYGPDTLRMLFTRSDLQKNMFYQRWCFGSKTQKWTNEQTNIHTNKHTPSKPNMNI